MRKQSTPFAYSLASTHSFKVPQPETVEAHLNRGDVSMRRIANIKKVDVIGKGLSFKGETNRLRGGKTGRGILKSDPPAQPFGFGNRV